jgi:hypothetical protein
MDGYLLLVLIRLLSNLDKACQEIYQLLEATNGIKAEVQTEIV